MQKKLSADWIAVYIKPQRRLFFAALSAAAYAHLNFYMKLPQLYCLSCPKINKFSITIIDYNLPWSYFISRPK